MGEIIVNIGGGGGVSSGDVTASRWDVVQGKRTVTTDSGDEVVEGTLPEIFADTGQINSFQSTQYGIYCVDVPKGAYRRGDLGSAGGRINIELSKLRQDIGYTDPSKVLKGTKIAGQDGTLDVQSILSFSAAPYSSDQITFTWKNPAKGAFSGVILVGKTGSYPANINDGTRYYKGFGNNQAANGGSSATIGGFVSGTAYYFRAFSYAIKNGAEWVHPTSHTAAVSTTKGQKVFTASTTWTVPEGVRSIDIFCVGGGGGGDYGENTQNTSVKPYYSGTGGGGGYTRTAWKVAVVPAQKLKVIIGNGGTGGKWTGKNNTTAPTDGSKTSVSVENGKLLLEALGGKRGTNEGGDGGSGGGGSAEQDEAKGGNGGSNGGNGSRTDGTNGGNGQGTTTKAFGENTGTLYAGGGGAGGSDKSGTGGIGGPGGGGNGARANQGGTYNDIPLSGTANTGGGGGGGASWQHLAERGSGADGGSGVCIIRWGY